MIDSCLDTGDENHWGIRKGDILKFGAVFIDFENLYLSLKHKYKEHDILFVKIVEAVIDRLENDLESTVVVRRNYLPFGAHDYATMADELALDGFKSVHVLAELSKNSADLMLAVDAMETVYTRDNIEVFCIVGGDRDYIPVVAKLKELGKYCVVCSMPGSMSGDLLRFIGEDLYFNPTEMVECILVDPKVVDRKSCSRKGSIPIDDEEVERWRSFVKVAYEMKEKYGNPELWMAPYITLLSERFQNLARKDIRDTIASMEKCGIWKREERESDRANISSYSVLIVDWNHSLIKETLMIE
jgi:uncharacterized LabA/DUF88 family protein